MKRLPCLVVMGVAGSGKTTLGRELGVRLNLPFQEGDDLHPESNIEKMRSGLPLTDKDRLPWLEQCRDWLRNQAGQGGVLSCSALKRSYRDILRSSHVQLLFVFPDVPVAVLRERLRSRSGHFMKENLLESQIATFEPPTEEEHDILTVSYDLSVEEISRKIRELSDR